MIYLILAFGFLLRLINLNQSLWFDEGINVFYARELPLWDYLTVYMLGDFHPPLWFFLLWISGHLLSFSEVFVRLPAVILGVLTIFVTYLIGREHSKKAGFLAALLLAIAPLHIYYSQEARPYALSVFSVTLSYYVLIKYLDKKRGSLFYGLSLALILYSEYVAYFAIFAQALYTLFYKRSQIKNFLTASAIGLILFCPWLLIFPKQLQLGTQTAAVITGWREVVGGASLGNFALLWIKILIGRISFNSNLVYGLVLLAVSFPYAALLFKNIKSLKKDVLFLSWLIIPVVISLTFSLIIPVFSYFRLIFILPAFYLLSAVWICRLSKRFFWILLIIIVLSNLIFSLSYLFNPKFQREDWRGGVEFIKNNKDDQTLIMFEYDQIPPPFYYYYPSQTDVVGGLRKVPAADSEDLLFGVIPERYKKIYLFEYLVEISDKNRLLEEQLESSGFIEDKKYDFRGIGFVREYKRNI